uniref:Ig-like domain-containing protein n=1 Tax=Sus scrofa TaxID=9823 RepID=A0A8D1S1B4_PIG
MKRLEVPMLGLLLAQVCCVRGVDVGQRPPVLSLTEGISDTIWCNSSASVLNVLRYRQNPGGRLIELFYIPTGTNSLYISFAQITDSATYFCAVEHSAPQAPTACTGTLLGAQPLLQPQSARAPPKGICTASFSIYIAFSSMPRMFSSMSPHCVLTGGYKYSRPILLVQSKQKYVLNVYI